MPEIKTLTTLDLDSVTGGFGFSDFMQGQWSKQADASAARGKDPSASTSAGPGKSEGTFTGGFRNLMSGFGLK